MCISNLKFVVVFPVIEQSVQFSRGFCMEERRLHEYFKGRSSFTVTCVFFSSKSREIKHKI